MNNKKLGLNAIVARDFVLEHLRSPLRIVSLDKKGAKRTYVNLFASPDETGMQFAIEIGKFPKGKTTTVVVLSASIREIAGVSLLETQNNGSRLKQSDSKLRPSSQHRHIVDSTTALSALLTTYYRGTSRSVNRLNIDLPIAASTESTNSITSQTSLKQSSVKDNGNLSTHPPHIELTAIQDIEDAKTSLKDLSSSEREALVLARLGQGRFREDLKKYWKACAVTGCSALDLLVASHIKPWRLSALEDKRNPYNGLLLLPNIDRLFDRGLISLSSEGELIIADTLDGINSKAFGIVPGMRLRRLSKMHEPFLNWHRRHFGYEA